MKSVLLTIALLTSQVTFATIKNSNNEARHQALIEAAIQDKCGSFYDITQYSQTETLLHIDNGIVDLIFLTVMYGKSALSGRRAASAAVTAAARPVAARAASRSAARASGGASSRT